MKKIFSAFLLMTMMVASVGSFVSCSDIEDAIAKVEGTATENAAQIKDLESKIAALQTALATAQADAAAAKAEANAAKQAAATAKAEAIEAALAEIAKVQDDVDAANAEIKKINDALAGYATKEAVELLESTVAEYKALTDENTEAIEAIEAELAALKEAGLTAEKFAEVVAKMKAIDKDLVNFAKAIANQIQSISYVPEYESGMQTYSYTMPTGPKAADKADFVLVMGTYEVSPKELAAELTNENTFFTAVQTKAANKAEVFEARIVSTDAATGRVVAYAYVPATKYNDQAVDVYNRIVTVNDDKVALAFGVAEENIVNDTENIDLGTYVTSSYEKVEYKANVDIKNNIYFYDGRGFSQAIEPVKEVEFSTPIANSTRNLFEGYMYVVNFGSGVYTLAQAEAILGTPLAISYTDGVVEYDGTDANKYIKVTGKKYDATAALIKAATKDQVGLSATLELDGNILLNGKVTNLYAMATYEIVNKTYGEIVVDPVTKAWAYDKVDNGKYAAFTAVELGVTGVNNVNDLFTIAGANEFTMTETVAGVTYTATIMKYASNDAASTASKIVKASIPALPFGKTYVFETTLTDATTNVDYPVSFEVTIGAAPKNVEIDLGTLNATVSANKATVITSDFVGQALAKHADFYTGVTFGQVFESFDDVTTTVFVDNLDVETATTAVTFTPAAKKNNAGQYVDASGEKTTDAKKYVEASTITINGLAKGTYNLKHTVTVFGVKYTYVAVINVTEPAYSLATVPQFVKDGQVIVSGVTTMPKFKVQKDKDGNVISSEKLNDASFEADEINLKDYFYVEGVNKAYANDVKVVYVVSKYTSDYKLGPIWNTTKTNLKGETLATVSNSSTVSTENGKVLSDAKVTWGDYDVDRIQVTAYLVKSTVADNSSETELSNAAYDKETITIVQRDRISSFTQIEGTGSVEYKSGVNEVNIMKFIETKDFNGNILSNPYATSKAQYWHAPTGKGTEAVASKIAALYGQEIEFGTPSCEVVTANVEISANGTLIFTNNSAELQSDVVVTIPVYLGYEYDNLGSTAKKVDVKVTFTAKK